MINPEEIQPRLKEFFGKRPEVLFAYLYGSYAKGTANRLSDVDVAVFLDENMVPKEKRFNVRLELIGEVMSVLKTDEIDVVILNDAPPLLAHQVIKFGIVLASRDESKRISYSVRSFNKYIDYKALMAPHFKALSKRLKNGTFGAIR